jgi:tripartite-type tricarboxylate transporter receptor subunit TctC
MLISRRKLLCGALGACAAIPKGRAQEAQWPTRPLRIIIPTAPGGSPDIAARLLGDKISGELRQSVVVESMTAGGGIPGLQLVSNSAPDGYTYAMLTGGFATQAAVMKKLPYRPIDDFSFISSVVRYPIVYVVAPDSPIRSFKDYIERARTKSNAVSNGIAAAGSVYHLLGKWIDNLADIEVSLIFYRGTTHHSSYS